MTKHTSTISLSMVFVLTATLLLFGAACSGDPKYVRDEDEPRLDDYTMSLRFDRRDLDRLYQDMIHQLLNSSIVREWDQSTSSPNVAIFPLRNETSEHLELRPLEDRFQGDLVTRTNADVIARQDQQDYIDETEWQQQDAFDPTEVAQYGRQMGAQYAVTGRVYDVAERVEDQRRVQYFMFVQVVNVATSQIHFQHEAELTKGLIR